VASAQPPAPAPAAAAPSAPWTGNVGFGLALNRGNSSTTNLNFSFDVDHNLKTASVWKFTGLYLRGTDNGSLAVDQLNIEGRNERALTDRAYAFGQLQFLRDHFKAIDYLWAPSVGVGYKAIDSTATTLNLDAGLGFQVEQYTALPRHTNAVVTASDKLEEKFSSTASLTQGFDALWKVQAFGDALYTFRAGAAASMTTHSQLKVEWLDTYATRPPVPTVKSNDSALLTTLVYTF
jgi:putative salt-induced outer membrane protein YdiY